MEEHERRVAHMIGSEAREALRGQKKPHVTTIDGELASSCLILWQSLASFLSRF